MSRTFPFLSQIWNKNQSWQTKPMKSHRGSTFHDAPHAVAFLISPSHFHFRHTISVTLLSLLLSPFRFCCPSPVTHSLSVSPFRLRQVADGNSHHFLGHVWVCLFFLSEHIIIMTWCVPLARHYHFLTIKLFLVRSLKPYVRLGIQTTRVTNWYCH